MAGQVTIDNPELPEYGTEGWVPLEMFGMEHRVLEYAMHPVPDSGEIEIETSSVWGFQEMVFEPYVRQLAETPGAEFTGQSVVLVIEWPDGTHMTTGHHRAAAAYLRGDRTMAVRVIARAEPK